MPTVQAPDQAPPPSVEDVASTSLPAPQKPRKNPAWPSGANPLLRGLTARPARPSEPRVTRLEAERGGNLSEPGRSADEILGKFPPPPVRNQAAGNPGAIANTTLGLSDLPTECLREMNLDPHQMQLVSRQYADIYHGEAVALSLASTPARARSLAAVSEAVDQLERLVPAHLRHRPLAVLCARLEFVARGERVRSFNVLFEATQECVFRTDPLAELFRQIKDLNPPRREACEARLMSVEGAYLARITADANDVHYYEDIAPFLQSIGGLAGAQKSEALGVLANRLFSLRRFQHKFTRVCETFHNQPWPPAAASGLLSRIGWISAEARQSLTALSEGLTLPGHLTETTGIARNA